MYLMIYREFSAYLNYKGTFVSYIRNKGKDEYGNGKKSIVLCLNMFFIVGIIVSNRKCFLKTSELN